MSLIGTKTEAAVHIVMPGELTAEIPAISAKVGAAASPNRPATSTAGLSDEATFSVAMRVVISDSLIKFAVCSDTMTLAWTEGWVGVTSVTGFQWTR